MKSFKEFLGESDVKMENLASGYINDMSDPKVCAAEFGSSDFDELCAEAGNCAMISNSFVNWLKAKNIKATTITGVHAKNEMWARNVKVAPGSDEDAHTVVLVGTNAVIDLTARQFDQKAKFPKICTYAEFKKEWEEVD